MRAHIDSLEASFANFFSREAIGLAFLRAWSATFFTTAVLFGAPSNSAGWGSITHQVSLVALILAFFGVALLQKVSFFRGGKAFRWASVAITEIGSGCIIATIVSPSVPSVILGIGAFLTGVGSAMMTISWGSAYAKMSQDVVFATTLSSYLFSGIFVLAFNSCADISLYILALLSPIASAFCLHGTLSSGETPVVNKLPFLKTDRPRLYRTMLYIALFSIVIGAVGAFDMTNTDTGNDTIVLIRLAIAAVSALLFVAFGNLRTETLLVISSLILAVFLLTLPFAYRAQGVSLLSEVGKSLARVVFWTYLICSFARSEHSSYLHFGLGMGTHYVGLFIGGEVLAKTFFPTPEVGSITDLFAFSLIGMFLLAISYLVGTQALKRVPEAPQSESGESDHPYDKKIASVAQHFGLTEREQELLWHLAKGYSSKSIQSKFCISAPTVSTHSNSIYRKMGIHSKEEAGDVVRTWDDNPDAKNAPSRG